MSRGSLTFLVQLLILSVLLSLVPKYLVPQWQLEPNVPLVLTLISLPALVTALVLWFKQRQAPHS